MFMCDKSKLKSDIEHTLGINTLLTSSNISLQDSLSKKGAQSWFDWTRGDERGNFYLSNYRLPANFDNSNRAIVQSYNNLIFFGNRKGVAVFDGDNFELIKISAGVNSLAIEPVTGQIFVGCNNDFGMLIKNDAGQWQYRSLAENGNSFGIINRIEIIGNTIYFFSNHILIRLSLLHFNERKIWQASSFGKYNGLLRLGNKLFINIETSGLYEVIDNINLTAINHISQTVLIDNRTQSLLRSLHNKKTTIKTGVDSLGFKDIIFSFAFDSLRTLIGTNENKIFLFDGQQIKPFHFQSENYLNQSKLLTAVNMSNYEFAIATKTGGCLIINKKTGNTLTTINYQTGLPDDELFAIAIDNNRGLWLSHEFGLSRVNFGLHIKNYDSYPGLTGNLLAVNEIDTTIYVATTEGVFYLSETKNYREIEILVKSSAKSKTAKNDDTKKSKEQKLIETIKPVEENNRNWIKHKWQQFMEWNLEKNAKKTAMPPKRTLQALQKPELPKKNTAYNSEINLTIKKIYALQSINYFYKRIAGIDDKCRLLVKYRDRILVAGLDGLYEIYKTKAKLLLAGKSVYCIEPSERKGVFYLGLSTGIMMAEFSTSQMKWNFTTIAGNSNEKVYSIAEGKNNLFAGGENFLLKINLDYQHGNQSIVRKSLENHFAGATSIEIKMIEHTPFIFIDNNILKYNVQQDSITPFAELSAMTNNSKMFLSDESKVWTHSPDGWLPFTPNKTGTQNGIAYFNIFDDLQFVRHAENGVYWAIDANKSLYKIYDAAKPILKRKFDVFIKNIKDNQNQSINLKNPVVDYQKNNLSVQFCSPYFIKPKSTSYQYFVDGLYQEWSQWMKQPVVSNLIIPAGEYTVYVRAKNILGQETVVQNFKLTIRPPIWKRWWFYAIIIIIAASITLGIFRLRVRQLQKEKLVLESIVQQRTAEIVIQKNEIEKQRDFANQQNEKISNQNTELELHRNNLEKLVNERTFELLIAKEKAEESVRLKSSFLANMTHEIRTPLNAILGFTQLLNYAKTNDEKRKEYTRYITDGSESLINLVDNIIDISELETGQFELDNSPCEINNLLNDLYEDFINYKTKRQKEHIELKLTIPGEFNDLILVVDEMRLKQIFVNLLSNAVKFSSKGQIEFGIEKNENEGGEFIHFFVKDCGIGIQHKNLEIIFEHFNKIEEKSADKLYSGAGLGLSICRKLVKFMGGKMGVESEYCVGSKFYFSIPANIAATENATENDDDFNLDDIS